MDEQRKQEDPTLVCTCNDLYIDDIEDAITEGVVEYVEIMQYNDTLPRCGECDCHVQTLVAINNNNDNELNIIHSQQNKDCSSKVNSTSNL